jgi:cell division protein FtsN
MALKNRRVFELRLGKLGLALFVGGMSLLLFSFFLVGVFVGKNMEAYPERYASGLPRMIGERWSLSAPQPEKTEPPPPDQGAKEEPVSEEADIGLTFYDTLGGGKGGSAAGRLKERPGETPGVQETAKGKPGRNGSSQTASEASAGRQATTANVGEGGARRSTSTPEGVPTAETRAPKAPDTGAAQRGKERFEVQVGAYREKRQADLMVNKFNSLGFLPQVVMKEFPDTGRWFRVVVGGFDSRESAQRAADRMTGKVRGLKCVIRASEKNGNGG